MQPTLICSQPWNGRARRAGRWPGEALELEVALGGERVARQELRELVHLAGAEGDVDEREALEHLLLDRLRPAAADADDPLGLFALQALGLAEVRDEAAVGRLADRAGVEQDQVGLARARAPRCSRATRASPSSARSRARSSGSRTSSGGSASSPKRIRRRPASRTSRARRSPIPSGRLVKPARRTQEAWRSRMHASDRGRSLGARATAARLPQTAGSLAIGGAAAPCRARSA